MSDEKLDTDEMLFLRQAAMPGGRKVKVVPRSAHWLLLAGMIERVGDTSGAHGYVFRPTEAGLAMLNRPA